MLPGGEYLCGHRQIEPDFKTLAFASAFHVGRSYRSSMRSISVTETMPYE